MPKQDPTRCPRCNHPRHDQTACGRTLARSIPCPCARFKGIPEGSPNLERAKEAANG